MRWSALCHRGQTRKGSDIPYFEHAAAVALILDRAGFDEDVVIAGLLHDVVEDTDATLEDVGARFGPDVREMVAALLGGQARCRGPEAALDRPQARPSRGPGRGVDDGLGDHPRRQAPQPHVHRPRPGRGTSRLVAVQCREVAGPLVLPSDARRLPLATTRGSISLADACRTVLARIESRYDAIESPAIEDRSALRFGFTCGPGLRPRPFRV